MPLSAQIRELREQEHEKAMQRRRSFLLGRCIAGAIIVLLLSFGLGAKYSVYINGLPAEAVNIPGITAVADMSAPVSAGNIVVGLSGTVANKGYYSITPEVSMRDLLAFAGTVRDSDVSAIDFAHIPQHGDMYYVRALSDPLDISPWLQNDLQTSPADSDGQILTIEPVNINTAGLAQLMELPGIGEVKAQAIIDYRIEHNGFSYKEELLGVKGIGNKIYESIIDHITV